MEMLSGGSYPRLGCPNCCDRMMAANRSGGGVITLGSGESAQSVESFVIENALTMIILH